MTTGSGKTTVMVMLLLRRQSYDLNEQGLFDVEYADVLGVPFHGGACGRYAQAISLGLWWTAAGKTSSVE